MQTVEQAISQMTFYTDHNLYLLVKLPARAITLAAGIIAEVSDPFSALIVDKDEVSIMIVDEAIEEFEERLRDPVISAEKYRLITFDVELDLGLIGFMAKISATLADAKVPIMTYAAYTRDHLLVPAEQFEQALQALETLKSKAESQ